MKKPATTAINLVFLTLFISITGHTSFAKETLIAVTELWPPFRIDDAESGYGFTGIDIDIIQDLEKYLDVRIEVQRHPFARALEMIRDGSADIIPGVAHTKERAEFIDYVPTSYYSVGPVFYTQRGKGHLVKTYNDLYNFEIGYSLHSAYFEPFNSDNRLKKIGVSTEEQLIKMVALNRLDITIGTNPNFAYDIKRYNLKDKLEQTSYVPDVKTPLYLGLSKSPANRQLLSKIDTYLQEITVNGRLAEITSKYK